MKLNSGGLKLCAVYIIYAAVLITLAYFTDDPKGRFILGSFAWAPAGVTFGILHLFPVMYHHPWTNTPYFLFPACLVIVYVIGWAISTANRSLPRKGCRVGLRIVLFEACSAFTHVAACTLALSPIRDTLTRGFSHFVTSMTAPVASGWSGCRVGLAPTGKRRLFTAHALSGH
jgi:hypothetical protein